MLVVAMLKILESDAQVCTRNCFIIDSLHKSFKFDEHYMYVPLAITDADANECEIDPDINLR